MKLKSIPYRVMYHTSPLWSDRFYIRHQFKTFMGYWPDLDNPKTFQEKLQWLKLHDRKPMYSTMVDKYEAKSHIERIVGSEYVIPTIGIYDNVSQINYSKLPKSFVMKTTHDSGTVVVCQNKNELNINGVNKFLSKRLKRNYFLTEREWPYKNVKPRIIIEENINRDGADLNDYKFYCFNGEPKLLYISSNRGKNGGLREDFFDANGNHLDVIQKGYPNNEKRPSLPLHFEKMKEMSKILSTGIPHLRVDFYEINGKVYVGELTFSDGGGYASFAPESYNLIIGDWLKLPSKK